MTEKHCQHLWRLQWHNRKVALWDDFISSLSSILFLVVLPELSPTHLLYAVKPHSLSFTSTSLLPSWLLVAITLPWNRNPKSMHKRQREKKRKREWAKDCLIGFHSALSLLISPPDIIHLLCEFVFRSRTNTLANPLSWRSNTEQDICTHTHKHAHSSLHI